MLAPRKDKKFIERGDIEEVRGKILPGLAREGLA